MQTVVYPVVAESRKQELTVWKTIYLCLMGFNILSYFYAFLIGAGVDDMPWWMWIFRLITTPLAVYLGRLWKDRGFWLISVYFCLFSMRLYFDNPQNIFTIEGSDNILSGLWVFCGCYGLGRVAKEKELKRFLCVIASLWIMGMAIISCLGIYAAWTEQSYNITEHGQISLYNMRLSLVYLPTITGSIIGLSVLVATILLVCVNHKSWKILLGLALIPLILALALSDSRTAYISVPAGFGVMAFVRAFHKEKTEVQRVENKKKIFFAMMIAIMVFVISLLIIMKITPVFNYLKVRGLIPKAYAETVGTQAMSTRGFGGSDIFNGRLELWNKAFAYIKTNPIVLLIGQSKLEPIRQFENYYAHCHCLYLQVLVESGIPGLLIMISGIVYTLVHGIKTIKNRGKALWMKLLLSIPISLWIGDLAETFTWLRSSQCIMIAVLFISIGIINNADIVQTDSIEYL